MSCLLVGTGIAVFAATVAFSAPIVTACPAVFVGLILAGLFGFVTDRLTRPFRVYIPANIQSVRDMMPYAITSAKLDGWTRDEVSAVVKRLVSDQLGIRESEYTEDSSFSEDFNLD